jgi:hypothetical protein
LIDRGGAEGVGCGEHHPFAVTLEGGGELGDAGRLADAVDADDEDHGGGGGAAL